MASHNTQEQFAKLVNISQPEVSKLIRKGTLSRGATVEQWLREYVGNLRFQAAQHRSEDGKVDRVFEAAMLDRRRRENMEIELAKQRGELAPLSAVAGTVFIPLVNAIKTKILSFPSRYRSLNPSATPRDIDLLDSLCRETLVELSAERLSPEFRDLVEKYYTELHATAEAQGERVGGSVPLPQPRKRRRARKVADRKDAVSPRADGLPKRSGGGHDSRGKLEPGRED